MGPKGLTKQVNPSVVNIRHRRLLLNLVKLRKSIRNIRTTNIQDFLVRKKIGKKIAEKKISINLGDQKGRRNRLV